MTLHRDDRPRPSRLGGVMMRVRQANLEDRIGWGAMLMGGGVGAVSGLIVLETVARWVMGLLSFIASVVPW